jgi:hypothetical protein
MEVLCELRQKSLKGFEYNCKLKTTGYPLIQLKTAGYPLMATRVPLPA